MDNKQQIIQQLENIVNIDIGRNIDALTERTRGELFNAALSIASHDHPSVMIVTGFYIPTANPPAPETDGPLGSILLAMMLRQLHIPVKLITDEICQQAVLDGLKAVGLDKVIDLCVLPGNMINGDNAVIKEFVSKHQENTTHLIFIERVGPAKDGHSYNMRAYCIDQWTPPLHELIRLLPDATVIGIGDGGNEVGMGRIPLEIIESNINHGETIACRISCDHLIVAGVSNWGAEALAVAIAVLKDMPYRDVREVIHPENNLRILQYYVDQKTCVDGVSRQFRLAVDGLPIERHDAVIEEMLSVLF